MSQWWSQMVLLPNPRQSRSCSWTTVPGRAGGRATGRREGVVLVEFEEEVEVDGWTERERADGTKTLTLSVSTSQRSSTCGAGEDDVCKNTHIMVTRFEK